MGGVEIARRLVLERFPRARAAWLGGSTIAGSATAHSDLDITVLLDDAPAPYRFSTIVERQPVEFFVQAEQSLARFCRDDRDRRRPTTMRLVGSSEVLVDRDGSGQRLRELLHQMDLDGPAAATPDDLESRRYAVTDLISDLDSARTTDEALTVALTLFNETADLILATHQRWSGTGKWLLRELNRLDTDLTRPISTDLLNGLRAAAAGNTEHLHDTAISILNACGGAVFDGYRRGSHHTPRMVSASVEDAGVLELLALAIGGDDDARVVRNVKAYQHDPTCALLAALIEDRPVGVIGYRVEEASVRVLHIATAPAARRTGVGRHMLTAVRDRTPYHLPVVAETDHDALAFYLASGFTATSLGGKYPGVERFLVRSDPTSPAAQ